MERPSVNVNIMRAGFGLLCDSAPAQFAANQCVGPICIYMNILFLLIPADGKLLVRLVDQRRQIAELKISDLPTPLYLPAANLPTRPAPWQKPAVHNR